MALPAAPPGAPPPPSAAARRTPSFTPYIAPETPLREFTPVPLLVGTLLGLVFGASSLYLVLKVGFTVSASIPVAVISVTVFRLLAKLGLRDATILEHNVVQTAGSAGESIAFGVGVTMPAILILGFDLEIVRVTLVAVLGGLLGILMMIPLRRAMIVMQHGILKYPEGTACAEVLKASANAESRAAASDAARAAARHPRRRARLGAGARAHPATLNQAGTVYVPVASPAEGLPTGSAAPGERRARGARRRPRPAHEPRGRPRRRRRARRRHLLRVAPPGPGRRQRRELPRGCHRPARLLCGPGHQRDGARAARWRGRAQVRRAQGHADVLHHQGHPGRVAAVGAGAPRRDVRRGAGGERHPVAGLRRGCVPAALGVVAHPRRRAGAAGRGPLDRAQERPPPPDRGAARGRDGQEPGRAAGLGLHRRRGHRRHRDRVPGRRARHGRLHAWADGWAAGNPFRTGPWADALALVPFGALALVLYLTGRERLFRPPAAPPVREADA